MAITRLSGPLIISGGGPGSPPLGDNIDTPGASIFVHGVGLADARFGPFQGADVSASIPFWYGSGWIQVVDQAPSTLSAVNIVAAAVPVAGTPMTLAAASTGITVVPAGGYSYISGGQTPFPAGALMIDGNPAFCASLGALGGGLSPYDPRTMISRCLTLTSVGNDSSATCTIVGQDVYGFTIHDTVTLSNASTVNTLKAFKSVTSVTPAGTLSGSNLSVGTSDVYGYPLAAYEWQQTWTYWNAILASATTGYTAPVQTYPSTALTGDVRGTYAIQTTASNGTRKLQMYVKPVPWNTTASASSSTATGLFGVQQF